MFDALSRTPFVDSTELALILGAPHATVHRTLGDLLAGGIIGRASHGTAHLPSSQRYHLTANGIGETAWALGFDTPTDFVRTYPMSREWLTPLIRRMDAVDSVYRLAASLSPGIDGLRSRVEFHRRGRFDATITLHDGRSFGVVRQGLASYADYAYTPTRPGRRPFLNDRYQPYRTLAMERAIAPDVLKDSLTQELANIDAYSAFHNCDVGYHSYALSFIAATFLVEEVAEHEKSYVNYWKLLGERATWQQAFEEAIGLSVEAFYAAFDEWTLSGDAPIPTMVRFKVQLDWPDRSASSDGILRVDIEWERIIRHAAWRSRAIILQGGEQDASILYVVYPEGATGSGSLSLWSEEGCSRYLLGYYKDGEVVAEREEATLIEFTGVSEDLDWTIPVNSGSLPRILCQGCCLGISGES